MGEGGRRLLDELAHVSGSSMMPLSNEGLELRRQARIQPGCVRRRPLLIKIRKRALLLWVVACVVGGMGGCQCGKGDKKSTSPGPSHRAGGEIDGSTKPLRLDFPEQWRASDQEVNAFVESVLTIAAKGDYDGFRQLFAMTHTPPSRQEFQRAWEAIEGIRVSGLYGDSPEPEKYYLHAVVDRRSPDGRGRTKLDRVVMLFKEAGRWRLGPAPGEVVDVIVRAASRPATWPASLPAS